MAPTHVSWTCLHIPAQSRCPHTGLSFPLCMTAVLVLWCLNSYIFMVCFRVSCVCNAACVMPRPDCDFLFYFFCVLHGGHQVRLDKPSCKFLPGLKWETGNPTTLLTNHHSGSCVSWGRSGKKQSIVETEGTRWSRQQVRWCKKFWHARVFDGLMQGPRGHTTGLPGHTSRPVVPDVHIQLRQNRVKIGPNLWRLIMA